MSLLDALARLMILTDLQTNGGNFGFVFKGASEVPTLKVIDFRLESKMQAGKYEFNSNRFEGFLAGNKTFNYRAADVAVCYALHSRPQDLRVRETINVFENEFEGWEEKIEHAKHETIAALTLSGLLATELEQFMSDIKIHAEIFKNNFKVFEGWLKEYLVAQDQ